jgi:hypothetical protein
VGPSPRRSWTALRSGRPSPTIHRAFQAVQADPLQASCALITLDNVLVQRALGLHTLEARPFEYDDEMVL